MLNYHNLDRLAMEGQMILDRLFGRIEKDMQGKRSEMMTMDHGMEMDQELTWSDIEEMGYGTTE